MCRVIVRRRHRREIMTREFDPHVCRRRRRVHAPPLAWHPPRRAIYTFSGEERGPGPGPSARAPRTYTISQLARKNDRAGFSRRVQGLRLMLGCAHIIVWSYIHRNVRKTLLFGLSVVSCVRCNRRATSKTAVVHFDLPDPVKPKNTALRHPPPPLPHNYPFVKYIYIYI